MSAGHVRFSVVGVPQPQGNKSGFVQGGKVVMVEGRRPESRQKFKSWRTELAEAAADVRPPEPFAGPVSVTLRFRFLLPAGDVYRTYHATSPDIDKLARAVLDALKVGRVVVDDGRVCELLATKLYCGPGELPGVDVSVADFSGYEAEAREAKKVNAAAARKAARAS